MEDRRVSTLAKGPTSVEIPPRGRGTFGSAEESSMTEDILEDLSSRVWDEILVWSDQRRLYFGNGGKILHPSYSVSLREGM